MSLSRFDFPEGFLFGAATAAYQIEGSGFGGCGPCHWDTFAATPGNVKRAEDGGTACDHFHNWPADLDLLRAWLKEQLPPYRVPRKFHMVKELPRNAMGKVTKNEVKKWF